MYKVYADDVCIYDDASPSEALKLESPKLTLSDSAAGSFTFGLPVTNIGYNSIVRMKTQIKIFKDGSSDPYWEGRPLSESINFWKSRKITCEGILAVLNDTIQPPAKYQNETPESLFRTFLNIHNAKVSRDKRFEVGIVTVTDPNDSVYRYTNYENTMSVINDKLISRLGGHLRIRYENGIRKLDYLADYPRTSAQEILFGQNLVDFTQDFDMTDFCTVVVPRGEQLDNAEIDGLYSYLTVAGIDVDDRYHDGGSIYVYDHNLDSPVNEFGWIEKVVDWSDVTTQSALFRKAKEYLSDVQFDNVTLTLNAVDLHYLDINADEIQLLDQVRVISRPHGMNRLFPVTKLDIQLDAPEATTFTLGGTERQSLSSKSSQGDTELISRIEQSEKTSSTAAQKATELINTATTGYITIIKNKAGAQELVISNEIDYTNPNAKVWRWNMNGLGYFPNGYDGVSDPAIVAMTADGSILANVITAGILQDQNGGDQFYLDLDNGIFRSNLITVASEKADQAIEAANQASTGVSSIKNKINVDSATGVTIYAAGQSGTNVNITATGQTFNVAGIGTVLRLSQAGVEAEDVTAKTLSFGHWRWTTKSDGRLALIHV